MSLRRGIVSVQPIALIEAELASALRHETLADGRNGVKTGLTPFRVARPLSSGADIGPPGNVLIKPAQSVLRTPVVALTCTKPQPRRPGHRLCSKPDNEQRADLVNDRSLSTLDRAQGVRDVIFAGRNLGGIGRAQSHDVGPRVRPAARRRSPPRRDGSISPCVCTGPSQRH
jgi:hypothetical protein